MAIPKPDEVLGKKKKGLPKPSEILKRVISPEEQELTRKIIPSTLSDPMSNFRERFPTSETKETKENVSLEFANKLIGQGRKIIESLASGRDSQLGSPIASRSQLTVPNQDSSIMDKLKFTAKSLPRVIDPISEIGAKVYMPGAGAGVVSQAYQGAGNLVSKVAPKLANSRVGRVTEEVIKDAAVSAPIEFGYAAKSAKDNKELLKQTAIGTGIGAGAGGLISGAIEGVQALRRPFKLPTIEEVIKPIKSEDTHLVDTKPDKNAVEIDESTNYIPRELATDSKPITGKFYRGRGKTDSGNSGESRYGDGQYYANNRKTAQIFADFRGEGSFVEEGTVTLNKPFVDYALDLKTDEAKKLIHLLSEKGMSERFILKTLSGENDLPFEGIAKFLARGESEKTFWPGAKRANELLKKAGYDGIVGENFNSSDFPNHIEIVSFKNQKSTPEEIIKPTAKPKVTRIEPEIKPNIVPTATRSTVPPVASPTRTVSLEAQSQLDEIESTYQAQVEAIKKGFLHPEDKSKTLKGMAMKHSADKRSIVQGDRFVKVDGGLTDKELADVVKRERSNYSGKEVTVNGQEGTITKNAFGKVGVQFADGSIKFVDPATVKPKVDIDEVIKQQSAPKVAPNKTEVVTVVKKETVSPSVAKAEPTKPQETMEKERKFSETLKESEKTPQGFKDKLKSMYTPITNEDTIKIANKRISDNSEEATSYVLGNSRYTAEKAATAQRLIDHYNSQGNYQRAVDIAEKVSEEATRAGQGIQALSMFNKLSPEGVLVYAQRKAKKVNESIPVWSKNKVVTEGMAAQISELANSTKKMTGITDNSNNVIDILDRAKSGEKLTEADESALRTFIKDSQEFVKETTRKNPSTRPPTIPKDKRIRDNVSSFLDAQEKAAKERLRARGIQVSSTPLDVWADYAIIGASKMGKGTIKFADWSELMIKDLGESIKPQLKQLFERSRETFEASTKKITEQTVSQAERLTEKLIKGKGLEGKEAESLRALAQKVSGMSGETKRLASQDLQRVLQALDDPSILRRISVTQTIAHLLNPKTQVRNALGNELFYRIERINKLVATPIDIVRSKITGGQRTVTFKTNNQGEYWKNWMRGLKAGWKGVNVQGLETQYDLGSPAFKGKFNPMTYLEKALGASLKSFDTAAYMRAYNNTIGELATLKAMNAGKKGDKVFIENAIRNVDDNILKIADEYGRYVTFQDNNVISKGLVKLKRGLNLGKDFGMGDLILKYPKTPGALLMRALEYSPAGFVRSGMILFRPWIKKEPNTAEVMQSLSRAIIGTMGLSGMGYALADLGIITGSASTDRDIRELQQSAGQGQYQVNLSALMRFVKSDFNQDAAKIQEGDQLYTYDWAQPIAMAVSIGANIQKNISDGENQLKGSLGTIYNSLEGGLGTLTEQSVLQGLRRAVEGYPGQTVTDKIMDILSDIPSTFVPTLSNQVRQLTDNARRETYDPSKLKQSLNRAQTKIPGLAGKLPQQSDTLGRLKETYRDNNIFNVMFNPGFENKYKLSPEAKLIVGLIEETGDETLAPRAPSKNITIDGVNVKMTTEEYARMQQYQGEETRKRIERINPNSSLKRKLNKVGDALDKGGEKARDRLRKEME